MTKQELQEKRLELYNDYQHKLKKLNAEYAIDNNSYKPGDIFRDHIGYIKIEKIDIATSTDGFPCCLFWGPEMKIDGTQKKSGHYRDAWQCNEKK